MVKNRQGYYCSNQCLKYKISTHIFKQWRSISYIWTSARQNQQNDVCAQLWLRSAWVSTQSVQSLFLCALWIAKDPAFLHVARLIWVFAGHTGHFVDVVMCRLVFLWCVHDFFRSSLLERFYMLCWQNVAVSEKWMHFYHHCGKMLLKFYFRWILA